MKESDKKNEKNSIAITLKYAINFSAVFLIMHCCRDGNILMMALEKHNTVTVGKELETNRFYDLKFIVAEWIYGDI